MDSFKILGVRLIYFVADVIEFQTYLSEINIEIGKD